MCLKMISKDSKGGNTITAVEDDAATGNDRSPTVIEFDGIDVCIELGISWTTKFIGEVWRSRL